MNSDSDSTSSQCGPGLKWAPQTAQEVQGHQTSSVMQKKEVQAQEHAQAHQQAQRNPQSNVHTTMQKSNVLTTLQQDPSDDTDKGVGKTSHDTRAGNTKRTRSFEDILDHRLSGCPETATLCGIQALLPRQAGLRVVKQVAEGSFAKVVLAINKRNQLKWTDRRVKRKLFHGAWLREGQRIVMKCIQKGISVEEDFAIEREVAVHGRLTHPNIASCYGYYEDTRHLVMLLDFVDGQELKDILRIRRSLAESEASRVLLQAMRALAYLHAQQVVHRDISPRNCLVTASGRLYLIDFGLAVDLLADLSHVAPGAGTMVLFLVLSKERTSACTRALSPSCECFVSLPCMLSLSFLSCLLSLSFLSCLLSRSLPPSHPPASSFFSLSLPSSSPLALSCSLSSGVEI